MATNYGEIRVAVLGCGMMGQEHVSYMSGYPHVKLVYLCDPEPNSIKDSLEMFRKVSPGKAEPQIVESEEVLFSMIDCFDLLVIATPNHMHTPVLLKWGMQKVSILCEKPIAVNEEQVAQLKAAVPSFQANIWVAMEYRYIPAVQKLLSLRSRVGQIKAVTIRENRFPFLSKVGEWNKKVANTGDTLVEKCCHFMDLFRLITGQEVNGCSSRVQRGLINYQDGYNVQKDTEVNIIDSAYVLLDFDNGNNVQAKHHRTMGCLELCMYADGSRHQEEIIVTGTEGRLEAYLPENKTYCYMRPSHAGWPDKSKPPPVASIAEEIFDCSDLSDVYEFADSLPKHTGYHYGSTAVEWKLLLDAIEHARTGERFQAQVSVEDGIAAVEIGILAQSKANA
jgi:predicted dehydrogenase